MPNKGAITQTLEPQQTFYIPKGYHNGDGTIKTTGVAQAEYDKVKKLVDDNSSIFTLKNLKRGEVIYLPLKPKNGGDYKVTPFMVVDQQKDKTLLVMREPYYMSIFADPDEGIEKSHIKRYLSKQFIENFPPEFASKITDCGLLEKVDADKLSKEQRKGITVDWWMSNTDYPDAWVVYQNGDLGKRYYRDVNGVCPVLNMASSSTIQAFNGAKLI